HGARRGPPARPLGCAPRGAPLERDLQRGGAPLRRVPPGAHRVGALPV
ncbi:MAG: hypothetical protein AVDCRST_MAG40-2116, partial [uncultured Gemmatimonadaceae bacterium]